MPEALAHADPLERRAGRGPAAWLGHLWLASLALLALAFVFAKPAWRRWNPGSALQEDCRRLYEAGEEDPWGRPFEYRYKGDSSGSVYRSLGPNGVDEGGEGDDVDVWIMPGFPAEIVLLERTPGHVFLRGLLLIPLGLLGVGGLALLMRPRERAPYDRAP